MPSSSISSACTSPTISNTRLPATNYSYCHNLVDSPRPQASPISSAAGKDRQFNMYDPPSPSTPSSVPDDILHYEALISTTPSRYGEIVDVNLVRDKATGKSKGFAFIAYEDQRSTILAVDNLNGAKVLDRIVRVDHAGNYKKKEEEDEEKEQQKREARGVCRAYQKGECNRGAACRFSHDEQRGANTGWGPKDSNTAWGHDRYDGPPKSHKNFSKNSDLDAPQHRIREAESKAKPADDSRRSSRMENEGFLIDSHEKRGESSLKDRGIQGSEKISERKSSGREAKEDLDRQSGRNKSEQKQREEIDRRSRHDRDFSSRRYREEDEKRQRRE